MGAARVLREIKDATVTLPDYIRGVAALEGVTLVDRFTVYTWWKTRTELTKVAFPALSILWDASAVRLKRPANGRTGSYPVTLSYGFRSTNAEEIERHMLYVPDAIVAWLEAFPVASRANTRDTAPANRKTIVSINLSPTGAEEPVAITHEGVEDRPGSLTWGVDVALSVYAIDDRLPRAVPAP